MVENSQQSTVTDEQEEAAVNEKRVPVSEAIRYRKRAQAAEKELDELKERLEQQGGQVEQLKQEIETFKTSSPVRGAGPLQGEGHLPQASSLAAQASVKTQGVKETRTTGTRTLLQHAAKQAAVSGSRTDVQEYLRLRRNFV